MKGGIGLRRKIFDGHCYQCYVHLQPYKEKIVKNDLYRITYRPYKFRKLQYSTLIVNIQFNSKYIIRADITTYNYRFFFDPFVYNLYFIMYFINSFHFSRTLPLKSIDLFSSM